jgi:hypothetical protein
MLDADAEGADWREVALIVLHIDPEPIGRGRPFDSHPAPALTEPLEHSPARDSPSPRSPKAPGGGFQVANPLQPAHGQLFRLDHCNQCLFDTLNVSKIRPDKIHAGGIFFICRRSA